MKSIFLFFIVFLFFNACSNRYPPAVTWNSEITVKLMDSYNLKENRLLASAYSNDSFELRVPLVYLNKYIYFDDDEELAEYCVLIDSLVTNKSEKTIITHLDLHIHSKSFNVLKLGLFKSGDYYIYNTKSESYVEKVLVKWSGWYGGILALQFDAYVYIGDYLFWEYHVQS